MIHRLIPGIKSCVGHGQMSGEELETVMHDFVRGDYDVLIATTIVESGLDIPNANTIIINQAQNYGLSVYTSCGDGWDVPTGRLFVICWPRLWIR